MITIITTISTIVTTITMIFLYKQIGNCRSRDGSIVCFVNNVRDDFQVNVILLFGLSIRRSI